MTAPSKEAIEAAARALFEEMQELDQDNSWDDPLPDEWRETWRYAAGEALSAAYPLMEAQAKAEALAQLIAIAEHEIETGTWQSDKWTAAQVRDWLRARAATIEGKDS